ncbi:hypothetical protein NMY22_g8903 [Coprinellus aureogranulatus]|nr:hypothetical protein NMY22_g8903 [Coprinellus aureogranulatus]
MFLVPSDPSVVLTLVGWGLLCLGFVAINAYAMSWHHRKLHDSRIKRRRFKVRKALAQKESEIVELDAQVVALKAENEELKNQAVKLGDRCADAEGRVVAREAELLKDHHAKEQKWQEDRGELKKAREKLKEKLRQMEAECTSMALQLLTLAQEKEELKASGEQNEKEVLELRDKLSECHHRLKSAQALDPTFYRPPSPDANDSDPFESPPRRKSDNPSRRKRGGKM